MALIFSDGFDHYGTITDFHNIWVSGGNVLTWAIGPTYARAPGGFGIGFTGGVDANSYATRTIPATATFICGFNVMFNSNSNSTFVSFLDSGTSQIDLRLLGSGRIQLTRNGTQLALSTNVVTLGTWYFLEIKATINDTTGAYEVRLNGSSAGWIPAATGADTKMSANNQVDQIRLHRTSWQCDDFYVLDTTGSAGNDFTNGARIITIYPNSTGNYAQWTGNYAQNFANVNEIAADGDSVFNMSSTAGHKDTFGYDDVPTATIHGIQHVLQARQDAGAARTIRPLQRSGGTDYNGTSFNLGGTHSFYHDAKSVNPATSAGYTTSDVNGAEFGYELVS